MTDTERQPVARVTMNMLYEKQLENERLLIVLSSRLTAIEELPKRVHNLEMNEARGAWIEKVAYAALTAGVAAVMATAFSLMGS